MCIRDRNEKYADTRGKEPLKKGEMPLLLPWCLIFSSALLLVKGAQVLFWQGTGFDAALAVLGLALTAVSALEMCIRDRPGRPQPLPGGVDRL